MSSDHRLGPKTRVFRVVKTVGTVTLALAGLVLFLAWMGGTFHEKVLPGITPIDRPKAEGRTLVTVERMASPETVTAVGSIQPRRKTEVASQLLATIVEIKARPGDRVKAGEILISLDARELLAQQREAVAISAISEADLVTRRSDNERIKGLRNTGAVSIEEASRVDGAFRIAEAQVRRAKETIARIEVQLTHTKIAASTDGLVAERFAEPGDLATPGKTLLSVYDPDDLELQINVPESLSAGLTVGQSLGVRIDANNVTITARIREIVPQAQQSSRSVLVKLGLPQSSPNSFIPGMYGRAAIPLGRSERIWLPETAVFHIGQLDLVEVVEQDETLTRRFVRVGRQVEGKSEILSGLSAGERVALPAK